jgi:uncharacterized protein YhbP (UPF0306 family)
MDQQGIKEFITNNLSRHKEFTLATVDDAGLPWVVALNLCYDDNFDIIWHSEKTTEHSKHLIDRPDVAICIFSDFADIGDFGLYAKAKAYEVTDEEELAEKLRRRFMAKGKPVPPTTEYSGDSPHRLYCARITEAWVNDQSHAKQKVDLELLRTDSM